MTDFVTRLEDQLQEAAVRRESAGRVRGTVLPRVRLALNDLPAMAIATVLLGFAVTATAIVIGSAPERAVEPGVPAPLRGDWRAGPTELRVYPAGAARCANLGLDPAQPCYTIGSAATRVAEEWGEVSVSSDQLTLHAVSGGPPGVYRWEADGGRLRLSTVRDLTVTRAEPLTSRPFERVRTTRSTTPLPIGWTANAFRSAEYGYSIRYPADWSARAASPGGRPDRLSRDPTSSALPSVAIVKQDLPAGTSGADWNVIVDSRSEAAGCVPSYAHVLSTEVGKVNVTAFRDCGDVSLQRASFTHGNAGYSAVWRGRPGRATVEAETPRFDALLRTLVFR